MSNQTLTIKSPRKMGNDKPRPSNSRVVMGDAFKRWKDNPKLKRLKVRVVSDKYETEIEFERFEPEVSDEPKEV